MHFVLALLFLTRVCHEGSGRVVTAAIEEAGRGEDEEGRDEEGRGWGSDVEWEMTRRGEGSKSEAFPPPCAPPPHTMECNAVQCSAVRVLEGFVASRSTGASQRLHPHQRCALTSGVWWQWKEGRGR